MQQLYPIAYYIQVVQNGTKLAFTPFYQTIQHFTSFSKLIREMLLFWNSIFSKSSYKTKKKNWKPYSSVLKSL